jgi:diguanylate cyclase (GGDEF)-like protein
MDESGHPVGTALQNDLELILQIGLQLNEEHDLARLLDITVDSIQRSLHYPYCSILLREGSDLVIRAVTEYPDALVGKRIPSGEGITGRCAASGQEMLVADVSQCEYYVHFGSVPFRAELDVPIVFHGRVLGVLNTQSTEAGAFGPRDLHTMKVLATQLGVALHNARIRTQLELLQDIGIQLVTILKTEQLFPWIARQVCDRLHYDSCAILRASRDHLVLEAATGGYARDLVGMRIPFGEGITGRCARLRAPVNVGDIRADAGYIPAGIAGARSELASPILFEGELLGVLTVESVTENAFDDDDVRLLQTLSAQVAVGLNQARMFAEAERMSVTDALTGLYNYRYCYERLRAEIGRSSRYGHPLSIVMIDLDGFKQVNDRFGHLRGDEVLRDVARIVRANTRRYDEATSVKDVDIDIASRYGGEEFIVIMPETNAAGAAVAAERIRSAIEREIPALVEPGRPGTARPLHVTGSFGVTVFVNGESPESLIKRADDGVYRAKAAGKNRVVAVEPS